MIVLGLEFYNGKTKDAIKSARGLCVFPSAPGLATIDKDQRYKESLIKADTRFMDSGYCTLNWFFLSGQIINRISGLKFLKMFFNEPRFKTERILCIHPTPQAQKKNSLFLEFDQKFPLAMSSHYVAPLYNAEGPINDTRLLAIVKEKSPQVIVINLGSNVQEPLGAYLKENLAYKPLILCTGGAIDFFTGAQAGIPDWADRLFLGWLFRVLATPRKQAVNMRTSPSKRYFAAFRLFWILARWRTRLPTNC